MNFRTSTSLLAALTSAGLCACSADPVETSPPLGVSQQALESCADGVDNDLDGLSDCADAECAGNAACTTRAACDGRSLQFRRASGTSSQLSYIDTSVPGNWSFNGSLGTTGRLYNACGYDLRDQSYYCVADGTKDVWHVTRGTPLGETKVGTLTELAAASPIAGDFDQNGIFFVRDAEGVLRFDPTNPAAAHVRTAWAGLNAADMAFSPDDGKLYALNANGTTLTSLNPVTGAVVAKTITGAEACNFGSQWFDASGFMFAACNTSGNVYRLNVRVAAPAAERLVGSSAALATQTNDGSSCPYAPGLFEVCANGKDDDGDGTVDESTATNACVAVPDTDSDGLRDSDDLDDDNDGIPDALERGDFDGDGVPDRIDLDSDNDGIPDAVEAGHAASGTGASTACTGAANVGANGICNVVETAADSGVLAYTLRNSDGDAQPDYRDLDSDGDGIFDVKKVAFGKDTNNDGIYDCAPGVGANGLCNAAETAADSGITDYDGNAAGPEAVGDADGDGRPNIVDRDSDNDGLLDTQENGDVDADGVIDWYDLDSDNDGITDLVEAGHGRDAGSGRACLAAAVGTNGVCDVLETAADSGVLNYTPRNTDGDTRPDFLDKDSDDDGITDAAEAATSGDADGNGVYCVTATFGKNGLCDAIETALESGVVDYDGGGADAPRDTDGDGIPDYRDLDSDNDGIDDVLEVGGIDANGNGLVDGADPNGNGLGAAVDPTEGGTPLARPDTDGDLRPNFRDLDSDNDGRSDLIEGGTGGTDANDDGVADGTDTDGDGILGSVDGLAGFGDAASPALPNRDGVAGTPDYIDTDSDGDGVNDIATTVYAALDADGDGRIDNGTDADFDGVADVADTNVGAYGGASGKDTDGDGLPDSFEATLGTDPNDADSDDDGVRDGDERSPGADTDGDGLVNALDADSDNDGLFDGTELGFGCTNPATDATKGRCIADADASTKTDPLKRDTDGGGKTDGSEDANRNGKLDAGETDPTAGHGADDVGVTDTDGDGLSDAIENQLGSDPNKADTDNDGVRDGTEANPGEDTDGDGLVNVLDADSDNDGLFDGTELGLGCNDPGTDVSKQRCIADADPATTTSPLLRDTDAGGATDGSEDANRNGKLDDGEQDPTKGHGSDDIEAIDSDDDGLSDALEAALGSDPNDADTDDDGVPDGQEANPGEDTDGDGLRNVRDADSDNDGLFDGTERGFDCASADAAKNRCVADADPATRTSALLKDTDRGGKSDGAEDANRNGKLDAGEQDPTAGHGADDAAVVDTDGDGLSDAQEATLGSDPNDADTDHDGLPDGDEPNPGEDTDGDGTINVRDADSDGDGLLDGTEAGRDCASAAGSETCIADADPSTTTLVLDPDTDHGGLPDGTEDANHDGRRDDGEKNPLDASDDGVLPPDGGAPDGGSTSSSSSGGSSSGGASSGGNGSSGGSSSGKPGGGSSGNGVEPLGIDDGIITGGAGCSSTGQGAESGLLGAGCVAALALLRRRRRA